MKGGHFIPIEFQADVTFATHPIRFPVLHAGEHYVVLQTKAAPVQRGLQFKVETFHLNGPKVRSKFAVDFDETTPSRSP